ncbi:5-formyltetrahydrofolate cyclo-ligase [Miniphocaeibacter halophilus]|uniref:5-formyltetrahydrofolate cyclo-ligase n=1 Tax=Miniphocaeibacter halophilus TaxID=2931922 RepID=A0AC61MUY6_9FIRM|nr:5-formyltetrahydrofolate cyclo-ligase [Miniphocaeibacter halophilus]QQK07969.1 5-formyltetrahydrofolate cyclo-ligase [Miniphocaeibacter halophilus]
MNKKLLRKDIIKKRDSLSLEHKNTLDDSIFKLLLNSNFLDKFNNIFCYVSFGSEINTRPIMEYIIKKKKNLYVPYIDKEENIMKLSLIKDLDNDLVSGYYNILEPKKHLRNFVNNDIIDLVITPGVAFTRDKYRMGYGGGFYDKFFASLNSSPLKIALAYNFQIVNELPLEKFDIPVDIIITEDIIIK